MPENTRDITLEEAKKLYNSSEEAKVFVLSKFTKEELGVSTIPTQEEFNKFFEEEILSKVDPTKTRFPTKNSFGFIQLYNSKGEWLLDYDYNPKSAYFYYQFDRVYCVLRDKFSLQDRALQALMKSLVESHFNLNGVTPSWHVLLVPIW